MSQLLEFTDGNMPPGLLTAPQGWNPDQIAQYQEWFDSILSGNLANKRKMMWGPDGAKYQRFIEPPLKDDFDEWLARVTCFAFSIPPTPFTKTQNRGEQLATKEAGLEEGLAPLMGWVKRLVDQVIQRRMGHGDLEFVWSDERPIDELDRAKIVDMKLATGRLTLNEARDEDGMDPVEGGDEIMFTTPNGPILLSTILAQGSAAEEHLAGGGLPSGFSPIPQPGQHESGKPGAEPQGKQPQQVKPEQAKPVAAKKASATLSQADAEYQATPHGAERCDDCTMFDGLNACSLVRGKISHKGWCKFFQEAPFA